MPATIPLIVVATQVNKPIPGAPIGPMMFTGIMMFVMLFYAIALNCVTKLYEKNHITYEQDLLWSKIITGIVALIGVVVLYFCISLDHPR